MIVSSLNKIINLVLISFALGITGILFSDYILGVLAILIIILLSLIVGEKVFLGLAILSFLTLTSTLSLELRLGVQLFNFLILLYIFFKNYGLTFSRFPEIPGSVIFLIFLIYFSMIFSTIFSDYVALGIQQIIRLSIFFLLIYVIYSLIEDSHDIKIILIAFFLTGLIYCISILIELANNDFSFIQMNLNQLQKVGNDYINMNTMGSFLIIVVSITIAYLFGYMKKSLKRLFFFLLIFFLIGLFITNSRAAILGIILSFLFLLYNLNKKVLKFVLGSILMIIPLLFIGPVQEFVNLYFRMDNISSGRNFIMETIYNVIINNPVLGYGPAATKFAIYPNLPFMLGSPAEKFILFHYNQIEFGHAHNFYLFFWSDLGIPGLITSLMLPVIFFRLCLSALKKIRKINNNDYYYLILGITGAGIGLFTRGFFEWGGLISYGTINSDLPFWIIFSIIMYLNIKSIHPDEKIFPVLNPEK